MSGRPQRVPAALAAALALGLGGAGCATVPSGGRVVTGHAGGQAEQADDPYVRLIPAHPRADWKPDQLVAGFLAASGSFDDDHRVAREYLTGSSTAWNPGARPAVTVVDAWQAPQAEQTGASTATVQVRGKRLGRIGPDGQYIADPEDISEEFQLTRGSNGWRISGLPDDARGGLLLTKSDVDRSFRTMNLYYFAPERATLVPNGIFLPLVNRRDLPSQLVQALLAGPSSWLGTAVKNDFPEGTRLRRLTLDNDTATVDLSGQARRGDVDRMSAQLAWTLRQLSEIKQWKLQIDGDTVAPEATGEVQPVRAWQGNAPDGPDAPSTRTGYVIDAAGALSRLAGDRPQQVALVSRRLVRPAVSSDAQEFAGLSPDGRTVLTGALTNGGATALRTLLTAHAGTRFTAPGYDRDGTLWTVETSADKSWLWTRPRGKPAVRVQEWGLSGREVTAFRVARDGVRAAAIVKVDGATQIQIGRIVRSADGTPAEAGSFLPVSAELAATIDLAWRDYGTLAVLGRRQGDQRVLPFLVPVSGSAVSSIGVGALGDPTTITAAPGQSVLVGIEQNGTRQVCRQSSPSEQISEWVCAIPGTDPAYPY
ncbi:LpqB family beta-propeller domain-containing protein [Actinomadura parmotrematis]|uniref:GerMN domain-containing protein n=1 Tax=Actinomadura parmotrematis TaxID=2864039 RepID=A0ABS7FWM1_9ACTN|nr:LpqB family beta-propeller domain-containing protein [Actinomadura parmotrematis]MBW8484570.1 GerMN domain-containing protein [Actinomadura parmotrematis]